MLLLPGCVATVTGTHADVTVTVTVNVVPIQPAKEVGVTV